MLSKFFKKGKKRKKIILKKDGHVHHDWALALIVFMFFVVVAVVVSGLIFFKINETEEVVVDPIANPDVLDQELLQKTLDHYNEKEERYLQYQGEVPDAPRL